jgi:2-dehydropantoate 2-reductase
MQIAIVGPGAMGLLMAGYLHKTDASITLVDHMRERADLFKREGIRWQGKDKDFIFKVPVTVGLPETEGADLVILCVKAYDTDTASRELSLSGYRGPVLTLQNGVGNVETVRQNLPDSPVLAGSTSEGANLVSVNHVRHAGKGKTAFGPVVPGTPDEEFVKGLAKLMKGAGLDIELAEEPQSLVWGKVLVNAGINPLTAILQVQNGILLEIPQARALMGRLVRETWDVMMRKGLKPAYDDPVARVEEVCRLTAANYSSMNQDIKHRRRTEIDFINGAIVREGERLGISCPVNDTAAKIVQALESLYEASHGGGSGAGPASYI